MKINIGDPAPCFTLFNTAKEEVRLAAQKGHNVLLLFFPAAFTGTCTKELCSVRDHLSWYNEVDAIVFGISVDSVYALAAYKQEQNLNFELLSDFNKEVSEEYGCLYETFSYGMRGVAKRAAFVIDRNGTVQYAEVLEKATDLPDFAIIMERLSILK